MRAVFAGLPQIVHDQASIELYSDRFEPGFEDTLSRPPSVALDLPRSARGEPIHGGFVLVMQADGRFIDSLGRPAATAEEAISELMMKAAHSGEAPSREPPVLLAFEQGAPLEPIVALIHLLAEPQSHYSGVDSPPAAPSVHLLAYPPYWRAPSEDDLPAWMKVHIERLRDELHTSMRKQKAEPLTAEPLYAGATCPALLDLMREMTTRPFDESFRELVRRSPQVIEAECGCRGVDVEVFAAWMWLRHEPWQPLVHGHPWAFGDMNAEIVEFPNGATVAALLPVVEARAGKPFRIAVASRRGVTP